MICPNCRQDFQGDRCPNCGRPVSRTGNRIAAVVIILLIALPCAAFGACSVVVGVTGLRPDNNGAGFAAIMLAVGAGAFVVIAGLIAFAVKLWRS